jgi:hypothetical protein
MFYSKRSHQQPPLALELRIILYSPVSSRYNCPLFKLMPRTSRRDFSWHGADGLTESPWVKYSLILAINHIQQWSWASCITDCYCHGPLKSRTSVMYHYVPHTKSCWHGLYTPFVIPLTGNGKRVLNCKHYPYTTQRAWKAKLTA